MNGRFRILALFAAIVGLSASAAGVFLHYERVERPATLRAAGPIDLAPLDTGALIDTVLPPASGPRNAAEFYTTAINHYNRRRVPFARASALYSQADEPPIEPVELALMKQGAMQRDCDLYAGSATNGGLSFIIEPGDKRWHFEPVRDPYLIRPYVTIFRIFSIAALNAAKRLETSGQPAEALRIYQSITRLGWHLRRHPGSLMDVQLAIELETKGLHYLDVLYAKMNDTQMLRRVREYDDSLRRMAGAVANKYQQLGNVEAAKRILLHDQDPLWRIEAAAALHEAIASDAYGWLERRSMSRALRRAIADPDRRVRLAALALAGLQPVKLRPPGPDSVS